MKIRNGFVSNSSSSSFLIFGESFCSEDFLSKIEDIGGYLETLFSNFSIYYGDPNAYERNYYIGRCPSEMKDNEIVGEWKAKIQKEIEEKIDKNIIKKEIKCGWCEESYYNG
jgi:hypothetical protein